MIIIKKMMKSNTHTMHFLPFETRVTIIKMVRLGDIVEVHRDGREFAYTREWTYNAGLVPAYGIPRRCWTQEAVYTGDKCVLITTNTPIYNTIGAVHYCAWVVTGPCAYTPDIWRITLKEGAPEDFTEEDIAYELNSEMAEFYNIGVLIEDSDTIEGKVEELLDHDIDAYAREEPEFKPAHYYMKLYKDAPGLSSVIPLGLPGLKVHREFADERITKITFNYVGAKISIHRGYVVAKFTEWDVIITDGKHLTKWDRTVEGKSSIGAVLCEYELGQPYGDTGEAFLGDGAQLQVAKEAGLVCRCDRELGTRAAIGVGQAVGTAVCQHFGFHVDGIALDLRLAWRCGTSGQRCGQGKCSHAA